jgi:nicotinamide-nucleotide amidase
VGAVDLQGLAVQVGECLLQRGLFLTAAESCTGGWICQEITSVPGSSAWFDRGHITYTNTAKQQMLGVKITTLERHGAVSGEVVLEMARGALMNSEAQVAVAVSGVAGPGGGSEEKPVGTVWIGWAMRDRNGEEKCAEAEAFLYTGDRHAVRAQTVADALQGILTKLEA